VSRTTPGHVESYWPSPGTALFRRFWAPLLSRERRRAAISATAGLVAAFLALIGAIAFMKASW